jgi:hypothetical protein
MDDAVTQNVVEPELSNLLFSTVIGVAPTLVNTQPSLAVNVETTTSRMETAPIAEEVVELPHQKRLELSERTPSITTF